MRSLRNRDAAGLYVANSKGDAENIAVSTGVCTPIITHLITAICGGSSKIARAVIINFGRFIICVFVYDFISMVST